MGETLNKNTFYITTDCISISLYWIDGDSASFHKLLHIKKEMLEVLEGALHWLAMVSVPCRVQVQASGRILISTSKLSCCREGE